ncbi:hypothetical protein G3578_04765 [Brevibacillus sp. SYP-B805]|uniref:hypothetical protein n=1 Tax=Brevibacillus sp. SYP-B805 TaxID=1578199 RepID=UPI0013EC63C9|nr:hypothetical protein [Brevibacillus sp. SYP-B805]NGQ94490.1 hypothetical protein [Brevibacillus sp. SYP-B805]
MNSGREIKAGDILVACDNLYHIPHGYMGHAAIAVDDKWLVEATDNVPYIRMKSFEHFLKEHPIHAQYRPRSAEMGQMAASCAMDYQLKYANNLRQGENKPTFAFLSGSPLHDPWGTVYCSKLVWLSYFYGVQYAFANDFGLFTPEDLDTCLKHDPHFELVYRHPRFRFVINT